MVALRRPDSRSTPIELWEAPLGRCQIPGHRDTVVASGTMFLRER